MTTERDGSSPVASEAVHIVKPDGRGGTLLFTSRQSPRRVLRLGRDGVRGGSARGCVNRRDLDTTGQVVGARSPDEEIR